MRTTLLTVAALLTAFIGCTTHSVGRSVQKGIILPDGAQHTELESKQKFLMAIPIENHLPDYPADAPLTATPVVICVEFVITQEGTVNSIHQIDTSVGCEREGSSVSTIFLPKVQSAVGSWTFFGAAICDYVNDESECELSNTKLTPLPIKLAYRFEFTQVNGKARITRATLD